MVTEWSGGGGAVNRDKRGSGERGEGGDGVEWWRWRCESGQGVTDSESGQEGKW